MRLLASHFADKLRHAHKTLARRVSRTFSTSSASTMDTDFPMKDESAPHKVHHDYTWLTKGTAASHTLAEIVKTFHCTEQGAKNAMTRRGISHCKDWEHKGGSDWERRTVKKRPAPLPSVEFVVGKREFEDGAIEYKVSYNGLDDEHAHWESVANLDPKVIAEYEEAHPHGAP